MAERIKRSSTAMIKLIVIKSEDGGETWQCLKANEVPDWIKLNDFIMTELVGGAQASNPGVGDPALYQAMTEADVKALAGNDFPKIAIPAPSKNPTPVLH